MICVSPTSIVSSLSPPYYHLSSDRHRHAAVPCHASFPLSQDELAASTSSSDNNSSHRLPSLVKTEALNPHHHRRPPSPDRPTPTLHYYKRVISTLATLPITQPRLHFSSSVARASHHWSSTRYHRSLSPRSHIHRPSTQRHPRWWTSQRSFTSGTTYRHVNSRKKIFWNSCKKIFWNSATSLGVIN
jgi:hypothetical protein